MQAAIARRAAKHDTAHPRQYCPQHLSLYRQRLQTIQSAYGHRLDRTVKITLQGSH
ncbi:predicted protein [Brucella neotomae 5K33]|uniref:Uncharacterized protein n=1 Tax=Brucella neotomae 5K33 TaxID=520456 RepID=A0A7U8PVI2_BRUNE|nr:predicted protein [Brucella neotomae 5K33]